MKIGILGSGNIASVMARTLGRMDEASCYAVASRTIEKAESFKNDYDVEKAYGTYEELVKDPEVELVYIATPHSHHYENIKLCLEHGKNVLCEKSFTVNAVEAKEVIEMAREKGLLLAEAIWTRYMPSRKHINEVISSGIIGKPNMLTANLGYLVSHKPRIVTPSLAGGALLDLGVYPINFALMAFGTDIDSITTDAVLSDQGIDLQNSMTFKYKDGKMAVLNSTAIALTDRQGVISGDNGYMVVENINNCERIRVYSKERKEIKCIVMPIQISGYEYQVRSCIKAIKEGKVECEEMPHSEIIKVMEIMDSLRAKWGVKYPQEQNIF